MVESVLDLTDSSAEEGFHFGDLAPLGSNLLVHVKNELIFFLGPLPSNNGWVKDVVPPFTALAAKSTWEVSGDDHPVLGAKLVDLGSKKLILLGSPLIAGGRNVRNGFDLFLLAFAQEKPSLEAPDFSLVGHKFAKSMPRLVSVDLN